MTDHPASEPECMFKCSDCGARSDHPDDVRFKYCGNCREFKGDSDWRPLAARRPGDQEAFVKLAVERPSRYEEG